MTNPKLTRTGGDLFIVDNSDADWKVAQYLRDWTEYAHRIDIATGYFEIGSLLALDGYWQKLDHIRILMGDEVSYRTKRAFTEGLQKATQRLDASLESEKIQNDFLTGVPAIVEAIRSGKIECRVYRHDKFHAKAYLTHGRSAVIGSFALVGSSNFTYPGLADNIELNVQIRGNDVQLLQDWYERHWQDAEDITADILRTMERHTAPRTPFEVWFKALDEYFRGRELEPDAWDEQKSRIFPLLDKYQQDAYRNLLMLAGRNNGAFLCDGVGLGKTFVGLMLIERLVFKDAKQVVLFAPKAVREDVWERDLQKYLPEVFSGFVNLVVYNHTDLQRQGKWPRDIALTLAQADAVIIDEAHHFRNPGIKGEGVKRPSRYRLLQEYLQNGRPKQVFMLTATPVNNSVHDFRHMIELFTGGDDGYFARGTHNIPIHNLRSHFIQLEKRLLSGLPANGEPLALSLETEALVMAEKTLRTDPAFEALVVQRSRAYVKQSQLQQGATTVLFPQRQPPQVATYNLRKTYGNLLESVRKAFNKERPLFVLGIYYPLAYWQGPDDHPALKSFDVGRQKQVVTLIRTLFLKRFESSARAFEGSCWRLLQKLLAWVTVHAESEHDERRLERWKIKNAELIGYVHAHQLELWPNDADEDLVEDFLSEDILNAVERLDPALFKVGEIIDDTLDDLDQLAEFLAEVAKVKPEQDDKLKALIRLLKTDPVLKKEKVILFSEFADTARYLEQELTRAGLTGICRIDGSSNQKQRSDVITRFSPYYNDSSSAQLAAKNKEEIRILIATDVLSEGLNLQDATRMINYDLHWNPVRLMQRIGRVDRRMNPAVEARLIADHPEQAKLRGQIAFWNFLPPDELDELLRLFQRVTKKTMVISRTLGIEGRKLLTPDDTFDPIKELNEQFDGTLSEVEQLRLEYTDLVQAHPELAAALPNLPLKTFSGKAAPKAGTQAVFFCFRIPRPDPDLIEAESGQPRWSDSAGFTLWACYDLAGDQVLTEPAAIARFIRSTPKTPRHCVLGRALLSEIRQKAEKQVVTNYLKPLQAPIGITPVLKCWMEVN
ncbi:MAG: DEAD/DEAH box helicase family protein [Chloroflexi bacterium]|nr:DEAD/DEAH box helicase family protein [Chloroflexota bacterium]MBP7042403.1 DEAD/DEAH box helicase family protein [Chloroflexota bacterium]